MWVAGPQVPGLSSTVLSQKHWIFRELVWKQNRASTLTWAADVQVAALPTVPHYWPRNLSYWWCYTVTMGGLEVRSKMTSSKQVAVILTLQTSWCGGVTDMLPHDHWSQ